MSFLENSENDSRGHLQFLIDDFGTTASCPLLRGYSRRLAKSKNAAAPVAQTDDWREAPMLPTRL